MIFFCLSFVYQSFEINFVNFLKYFLIFRLPANQHLCNNLASYFIYIYNNGVALTKMFVIWVMEIKYASLANACSSVERAC